MITFRRTLVQKRTRAKNGIRGLLRSLTIAAPSQSALWTRRGLACLARLPLENRMHSVRRDVLIEEIMALNRRIALVETELAQYASGRKGVELLQTIPGVGPRTAEAVAAFIDDPHRFPDSKRIGSYFGLVPKQDQSGDVNRMGHITRQGSATVRHLLTEAVWQASRRSPTIEAYLRRVQRGEKARRKIAIVATAHYLVRVMWAMLKNQTVWRETVAA
jgi:transposase